MEGQYDKAIGIIDDSQGVIEEESKRDQGEIKLTVETLAQKLIYGEKLPAKVVIAMNKAAILLCKDDLIGVKTHLDQMLSDMDLRVITLDQSSEGMIPDYIINLLVYFLLKTSKYQSNLKDKHLTNKELYHCRELSDGQTLDKVPQICCRCQLLRPNLDSNASEWQSKHDWLWIEHAKQC